MYLCNVMSKKLLWLLAGFMAIGMTALILVQTYWINNAIQIREKQFAQIIIRALDDVTMEIEKREAVLRIIDQLKPGGSADSSGTSGTLDFQINASSDGNNTQMSFSQNIYYQSYPPAVNNSDYRVRNDSSSIVLPESQSFITRS